MVAAHNSRHFLFVLAGSSHKIVGGETAGPWLVDGFDWFGAAILDFGSFVCLACLPTHVGSLLSVDGEVTDTSVRRGRVFWREARSPRGIVSLLVLARRTDKREFAK